MCVVSTTLVNYLTDPLRHIGFKGNRILDFINVFIYYTDHLFHNYYHFISNYVLLNQLSNLCLENFAFLTGLLR